MIWIKLGAGCGLIVGSVVLFFTKKKEGRTEAPEAESIWALRASRGLALRAQRIIESCFVNFVRPPCFFVKKSALAPTRQTAHQ